MTQMPPPANPTPPPFRPTPPSPYGGQAQVSTKIKPSGLWYLVAVLLLVGGAVLAVSLGWDSVTRFMKLIDNFKVTDVPSEITYQCPQKGAYAIYFVGPTAAADRRKQQSGEMLQVVVVDAKTGTTFALEDMEAQNLQINSENYGAWKSFVVEGPTTVSVALDAKVDASTSYQIAVGPKITAKTIFGMVGSIFGALAAAGGGFILALITFLVTLFRRSSCKNRMRQAGGWQ